MENQPRITRVWIQKSQPNLVHYVLQICTLKRRLYVEVTAQLSTYPPETLIFDEDECELQDLEYNTDGPPATVLMFGEE